MADLYSDAVEYVKWARAFPHCVTTEDIAELAGLDIPNPTDAELAVALTIALDQHKRNYVLRIASSSPCEGQGR